MKTHVNESQTIKKFLVSRRLISSLNNLNSGSDRKTAMIKYLSKNLIYRSISFLTSFFFFFWGGKWHAQLCNELKRNKDVKSVGIRKSYLK